ncbi:hypothetical protein CUU62_19085 [Pseudomonas sp. WP001]|uniref:Uncharacterized protein n=1 Tax=Pseudomonas orientalis TaxID=76758 RepID=A0A4Q7D2M2_9PSED|nr:hypothetical protein CUU62_19085 [Pseudomonas sp. WP001]RZI31987.1 hypothetical protein EUX57_09680 [Pseudomonas orientalis]
MKGCSFYLTPHAVGASLLAKIANDNAGNQIKRGALGFFASKLAPTVGCRSWEIVESSLNSNVTTHCNTAGAANSRTVCWRIGLCTMCRVFRRYLPATPCCRITLKLSYYR